MSNANSRVTSLDSNNAATELSSKAAESKVLEAKSSGHDGSLSGKKVKLNIYASEQEHGSDAVPVGLNGVLYQIPRDGFWEVPEELVGVLRDAVTTVTSPSLNGGGVTTREVPRFNFQVLPA